MRSEAIWESARAQERERERERHRKKLETVLLYISVYMRVSVYPLFLCVI